MLAKVTCNYQLFFPSKLGMMVLAKFTAKIWEFQLLYSNRIKPGIILHHIIEFHTFHTLPENFHHGYWEFTNCILPPAYIFNFLILPSSSFREYFPLLFKEYEYTIWASWESCKFRRKWSFVNISLFFSNTVRTLSYCPHCCKESCEEEL